MKRFQPNRTFYSENYEGFTSSDEFDLETRVHTTNELPPQDMFDMAHSMIKNDLWKWFFGNSFISNDAVYNEETGGVEKIDQDGYLIESSISKYVNGVRAKDFGPKPQYVWNPNYKADYQEYKDFIGNEKVDDPLTEDDFKWKVDYSKEYRRIEIDGVLLPEMDLLLHEAYRYLKYLYPNHPDFTKILTLNEFNDEISQAGAIIDYVPNFKYFEWLADKLDYSCLTSYDKKNHISEIVYDESSKLKIRNLMNYAFRKKFFGSKSGYKQFTAGAFQHASVMASAQYVPFESLPSIENKDYLIDEKWHHKMEKQPLGFIERLKNTSHALYGKFFRLIDWTNSSYDFLNRYKEPVAFYGTAYPTPYSQFALYEYPLQRVIDKLEFSEGKDGLVTYLTMANDFKVGQRVKINGQENGWQDYIVAHINSIQKIDSYSVKAHIGYDADGNLMPSASEFIQSINTGAVTKVDIDTDIQPVYTELKVYPSNDKILDWIFEHDSHYVKEEQLPRRLRYEETDILKKYYEALKTDFNKSTIELHDAVYGDTSIVKKFESFKILYRTPKVGKFTLDPTQNGCLHMAPQQFITVYPDELNIEIDISPWLDEDTENPVSLIGYNATSMSDDGFVQKMDNLVYDNGHKRFMATVLDIGNAYVQFELNGKLSQYEEITKAVDEANNTETARHGIVIKLSDSNIYAGGKTVVLFGQPHFGEVTEKDRYFISPSVYFDIKAIPRVKSHETLLTVYSDFLSLAEKKYDILKYLIGSGPGGSEYNRLYELVENIEIKYADFLETVDNLNEAYDKGLLFYNNKDWQKFDAAARAIIPTFETRPVLVRQLNEFYSDWIERNNVKDSSLPDRETFTKEIQLIENTYTEYYDEFKSWIVGEIAILIDKKHYESIDGKNTDRDYKNAVNALAGIDTTLFETMLPNRAFLLNPLPEDLLMLEEDQKEMSYALRTSEDKFVSILSVTKNGKYDDQLRWKVEQIFGTSGYLKNTLTVEHDAWNFGSLNTATVVETHYDEISEDFITEDVLEKPGVVDFLEDYYESSAPFIRKYTLVDSHETREDVEPDSVDYYSLNQDIITLMENTDDAHKFSYADPNFLEAFLPDEYKNNVRGEVVDYNIVKINCHFEEGSQEATFEEEAAMDAMQYLATGDQVTGLTIADDTFIESIDLDNYKIKVSKPFYTTGEAVLEFLCRIQFCPEDVSKDLFAYRVRASRDGMASKGTVFSQPYTSNISQYVFNSYIDAEDFKVSLAENLQNLEKFRNKFNSFVSYLYQKEGCVVTAPSAIKFDNKVFLDINAYTKFSDVGQDFIMSQKTLDYFEGYIEDISKVSDDVSVGASVNIYGKINTITEDDSIGLKFIATKYWRNMTPYYIKIGTGRLDDIFNLGDDEQLSSSNENKSYYGEAVYGNAVYSGEADSVIEEDSKYFDDIDKPLFKVQLGEYEVQNNIEFDDFGGSKNFTTVQFAVLRRQIENMKIDFQYDFNQDITFKSNIIDDWKLNAYNLEDNGNTIEILSGISIQKKFKYLGETIVQKNAKGEVVLPEPPSNTEYVYYYSIIKDTIVDDEAYSDGDIIIWTSDGWQHRKSYSLGFYGDTKALSKDLEYKEDAGDMVATVSNVVSLSEGVDIRTALLFKICRSLKIDGITSTYNPKGKYEELLNTYKKNAGEYLNSLYIFMFTGFNGIDFDKVCLKYGDLIGMVYINDDVGFIFVKIKKSLFTLKSKIEKSLFSEQEFESFTGSLFTTNSKILYNEFLNPMSFQLNGLTDIVKGTIDARLKFCAEKTIGTGYRTLDDGTVDYSEEYEINLTENDIIPNEDIERLTVVNDGQTYVIKQENNKYFKNIINNIVQHNKESSISSDGLSNFSTLSGIEGFDFDTDKMTMYDKYINIEKVKIRSPWSNNLEPTLFSKHVNVIASMKGFDISDVFDDSYKYDTENGPIVLSDENIADRSIILSYRTSVGVRNEINKAEFINEILKINPIDSDGSIFERDTVDFGKTMFNDKVLKVPTSLNAEIYNENDILSDIKWLKNNLVIEADVDLSNPTEINVSTLKATNALQKISISDKVVECYPLTAPKTSSYIEFDDTEFKDAKDVLLCGNFLVLIRDNGISIFYCEDIMKFAPTTKKSFSIQDIKTVKSGEGEIICSAAWDNEDQYLILSFSNKDLTENLGIAYFKISLDVSGEIVCEQDDSMTPVNGANANSDINTYQLVNVLSTQDTDKAKLMFYENEDGDWKNNVEVFASDNDDENIAHFCARDLAFIIVEKEDTVHYLDEKTVTEDVLISDAIQKDGTSNKVLEMTLSVEGATSDTSKVAFTGNSGAFLYDNITAKWVYVTISELSVLLEGNHGQDAIKSTVYVVDSDILEYGETYYEVAAHGQAYTEGYDNNNIERGQEQYAAQFLWQLPRPVNENELMMVVVYDRASKSQLKMTVKDCTLKNVIIKPFDTIKTVNEDGDLYSIVAKEDGSRPEVSIQYKLGAYAVDTAKPTFFASNNDGMIVAVNGDNIFVKSPTMRWNKTENANGFTSYNYTTPTSFNMWKRAKLPNVRDLSYLLFDLQSPEEAYELVKQQRQYILNNETILKNDEVSRMIVDFLKSDDFVIYSPEEYIDKHEENTVPGGIFESGLSINGVKFLTTAQGRVADFREDYTQVYENIVGVEVQQGVTVKATLLRQIYMNYLSDLYHLVLCQNRLIDIAEYGVKTVKMTSSSIIIVTQSDDVLTLDIENTYTRDDIENPFNWEVKSLNDALEYPMLNIRDNDGVIFTVGNNGEYRTLRNQIASVTNKAYNINTWYFDDKVQFFGGSFSVDESFKNYLKAVYDSDDTTIESTPSIIDQILSESEITAGLTYPFVAYSIDGGQSFEFDIITGSTNVGFTTKSLFKESGTYVYGLTDGSNNVKFGYYANVSDSGIVLEQYSNDTTATDDTKNCINWKCSKPIGVANCLVTPEVFYIENYTLSWLTGTVTAVSNNSFTIVLDSQITPRIQSEQVNVLLAIETVSQIKETREFLDYNPKYFNQIGKLYVNEYTEVDSRYTADRAYSQNEIRKVDEQSKTAFPGLCEDSSRSVYEYEERVDYTGNTIYLPVECTNTEGNVIKLYDIERGVYIFTRNAGTDTLNSYTTQKMLKDGISVDLALPMIKIQDDYSFVVKNENLRDILLVKDGKKYELQIEQYDKTASTIKLVPTVPRDILNDLKYLQFSDGTYADAFYEWPWDNGEIPDEDTFISTLKNYTGTDQGKVAFIRKLTALLDEDANFSKTFSLYYAPVKMSIGSSTFYGVAQLSLETGRPEYLLLQEQRLVLDVTTPYIAASLKSYENFNMPLTDDGSTSMFGTVRGETINSIYYGHTGYGGFFNTKDDDINFPWERDTEVFSRTLLTNDAGENVYIADENGENILTKNGLFFLRKGDYTEITYDNLRSGKTKLTLKKDSYENDSVQYNLFKREMEFNVYVPSDNVTFLGKKKDDNGYTTLTVLKIYEDDFEVSPERINKEYSIKLLTSIYSDESCTVNKDIKLKYSNRKLVYEKGDAENLYAVNDTLSISITKLKDGSSKTITFSTVSQEDFCTIESIDRFEYYDSASSGKVSIVCDKEGTTASSSYENIENLSAMSFNVATDDTSATFSIAGYEYRFDIRKFEPELLLNREWFMESENNVPFMVFSKSNDLTDKYAAEYVINEDEDTDEWTMTVSVSNIESELMLTSIEIPMKHLGDIENLYAFANPEKYVYLEDDENILYNIEDDGSSLLVEGIYGECLSLAPIYKSLYDVIDTLGRVYKTGDTIDCSTVKISNIIATKVSFENLIDGIEDDEAINVKIMPINTVLLSESLMNNEDYFTEVSIDDISLFSYDRVWVNEKINKKPVININGDYYHTDSLSEYAISEWRNKDNFRVYIADEDGHYVKAIISNGDVRYQIIGDEYGDCSEEIYQSTDVRINPYEALYKTSYDKYMNMYYDSTKTYGNPFYKYVKFQDIVKDGEIINDVYLGSPLKVNGLVVLVDDADFSIQNTQYQFDKVLDNYELVEVGQVDYYNGIIQVLIESSQDRSDEKTLAGIVYKNPFKYDESNTLVRLNVFTDNSFVIDSTEDVSNKEKSCVENITEVGIFSKNDVLIAYATHPIAQYDTKKNHIAYNVIVENS